MPIKFPDAEFVANGQVKGRLYDLGAYPGLLLGDTDATVCGEVYEVNDDTLGKLDQFEASSDYRRRLVEVSTDQQTMNCWVYVLDVGSDFYLDRTVITSGDWVGYSKEKLG